MTPNLQEEIRQSRPFRSVQEEAFLNLARTSAVLMHRAEQQFRDFGLTTTQYNVLRIVQGAGVKGISQCAIAARLVAHTPDVPRLLKRTEAAGLIRRTPAAADKRVLTVRLTVQGKRLLNQLEPHIAKMSDELFPNLSATELRILNDLLNACR
jgi:DNA-binding MarR family transcriptional regulator